MFDIGFFELTLVAVVALLVVGPERLPGLVRTTGFWIGKFRQMVSSVNDEVKRELHNAEVLRQETEKLQRELNQDVAATESEKKSEVSDATKDKPSDRP